jgi:hypothetical protein
MADNTSETSYGIFASPAQNCVITGNRIVRDSTISITNFIYLGTSVSTSSGVVTDNVFNSAYIDSGDSDDETINGTGTGTPAAPYADTWIIERNKNQTDQIRLSYGVGNLGKNMAGGASNYLVPPATNADSFTVGDAFVVGAADTGMPATYDVAFFHPTTESDSFFYWEIPLKDVAPVGTEVIDFVYTATLATTPDANSEARLYIADDTNAENPTALALNTFTSPDTLALSDTPLVNRYFARQGSRTKILVQARLVEGGATLHQLQISNVLLTYRW